MEHLREYFTRAYWRDLFITFVHALGTLKFWRELMMMTVGMSLGAAAVYYFLMPSHLIVGSISGLAIVFNTLFGGDADTFSYVVMAINADVTVDVLARSIHGHPTLSEVVLSAARQF